MLVTGIWRIHVVVAANGIFPTAYHMLPGWQCLGVRWERVCVQILNIFAGHLKQPVDLGTTGDQLQSLCCRLQTVQDWLPCYHIVLQCTAPAAWRWCCVSSATADWPQSVNGHFSLNFGTEHLGHLPQSRAAIAVFTEYTFPPWLTFQLVIMISKNK